MSTKNLIEGLQILIKYMDNKECSHVYAKYEEILFEETDRPVSNTDLKKLSKLGWYQEDGDLDEDGNFDIRSYVPGQKWQCYVSY